MKDERDSFEQINKELQAQFVTQLSEMPQLEQRLADVSEIPQKIDEMIVRLEQSNSQLYSNFILSTRETLIQYAKASKQNESTVPVGIELKQPKTSWIVVVCAILIAIACIANTVHNIWFVDNNEQVADVEQQYNDYQEQVVNDSVVADTAMLDSVVSRK